jgi:predicted nucleotide-binding protein
MNSIRIFIGSSKESERLMISAAALLRNHFGSSAKVTTWSTAFDASSVVIDQLHEFTRQHDYAILVFAGDDSITIRSNAYLIARDNVIYEAGLFAGFLGRKRVFILFEENCVPLLRIPTDLNGVVLVPFSLQDSTSQVTQDELDRLLRASIEQIVSSIEKDTRPEVDYQQDVYQVLQRIIQQAPSLLSSDDLFAFSHTKAIRPEHFTQLQELMQEQ